MLQLWKGCSLSLSVVLRSFTSYKVINIFGRLLLIVERLLLWREERNFWILLMDMQILNILIQLRSICSTVRIRFLCRCTERIIILNLLRFYLKISWWSMLCKCLQFLLKSLKWSGNLFDWKMQCRILGILICMLIRIRRESLTWGLLIRMSKTVMIVGYCIEVRTVCRIGRNVLSWILGLCWVR